MKQGQPASPPDHLGRLGVSAKVPEKSKPKKPAGGSGVPAKPSSQAPAKPKTNA